MQLTRELLLSRPYRYYYLLYDFIHKRRFELGRSGVLVPFDYMGNQFKFYTPDQFTSYHDVHDAIAWMKTTDIFFKHGDNIYPLLAINMPSEYENGQISDIQHSLVGVAVITKLYTNKKNISNKDIIEHIPELEKNYLYLDRAHTIEISFNVPLLVKNIIQSPLFQPLFRDELRYACNFVNSNNVAANLTKLIQSDKYNIKLIIGENRSIIKNDIKLFESVKGNNLREIKLGNRPK